MVMLDFIYTFLDFAELWGTESKAKNSKWKNVSSVMRLPTARALDASDTVTGDELYLEI